MTGLADAPMTGLADALGPRGRANLDRVTRQLNQLRRPDGAGRIADTLHARDRAVLDHLARHGGTNRALAAAVGGSERSVVAALARANRAYGGLDRVSLVLAYLRDTDPERNPR